MKPYHTSFFRAAAFMMLVCLLSFFGTQSASADCRFSVGTRDTAWSFTAAVGTTQSRTLIITNTSDSTITVTAGIVTGIPNFALNHDQFTLAPGDTASVIITFQPASNTTANTITGMLRLATSNTDCRHYLTLVGTVTSNHVGHDKVVTLSPASVDFPAVAVGADTCQPMYLVNYTGAQVKITSISLLHPNADFTITPAFNGAAMDSGGYYRFEVCCKGDANHTEFSDSLVVTYSDGSGMHTIYALLIGHTSTNANGGGDILVADPHAFSFGQVAVDSSACRSVIVSNKSTSTSVVVTGWNLCDSKDFSVSPAFSHADTLAPGHSMTFAICYAPQQSDSGAKTCGLTLNYFTSDPSAQGKSLVVSFYGIKAGSNTIGNTVCLRTEQGSNYHDPVVIGGSANHTLYLINNSPNSITLNTVNIYGPDASLFSIPSSQFPITVPANSTNTTIYYTFSPTSNSKTEFNAKAAFSLSGDHLACDSATAYLIGYVVHGINTVDTVVRPLFPNESRTLGLEGNGATVSTTFYFTNNLTVDCTVNKIFLASGKYFMIASTNPSPTPFVLHPGDNLTVIITYTATDHLVHHDSLMIDANHNLQAQGFELQGVQISAGVSASLPEGVAINVSPNPASSYVTVDMAGIRSADIQVIDLLGKNIVTAKASSTWKWNASNVVAGSYIVRIAGESTNGEQFVASKRIIVSK